MLSEESFALSFELLLIEIKAKAVTCGAAPLDSLCLLCGDEDQMTQRSWEGFTHPLRRLEELLKHRLMLRSLVSTLHISIIHGGPPPGILTAPPLKDGSPPRCSHTLESALFSLLLFPLLSPLLLLSRFHPVFSSSSSFSSFLPNSLILSSFCSCPHTFTPLFPFLRLRCLAFFPSIFSLFLFLFHSLFPPPVHFSSPPFPDSLVYSSPPRLLFFPSSLLSHHFSSFFSFLTFPPPRSFSSLFSVLFTCSFFHFLSSYLPSQLISPVSFLSSCLPPLLLTILPPLFPSFSPPSPSCQECIECVLDLQALRQALLSPRRHSVSEMRR